MKSITDRQKYIWFIYGMLLGAACFVAIYGLRVLDFTNDSWIMFKGDPDIRQHYLGWCHYRTSKWTFPIGMIDSLSYPTPVSVIYSDSIPGLALIFKAFSAFLPDTFQYLGLYGLICFMLTGGMASLIIRRMVNNMSIQIVGPLFFILSSVMIKRMFYHTSLSSQWLVLLGIYLLMDGLAYKPIWIQKKVWRWIGIACVLIHIYFIPIMAGFMVICSFERILREKTLKKNLKYLITNFANFSAPAILLMWVLGAFSSVSSKKYAVGEFGANLNTFINPIDLSKIIPDMGNVYEFQYEGSAYLGLGMLILLAVTIGIAVKKKSYVGILKGHTLRISILVGSAIFCFFAIAPTFAFCRVLLVRFTYPPLIDDLISIFRSNGRFIWPVFYFIMLAALKAYDGLITDKLNQRRLFMTLNAVFVFCILLNILDMSGYIMGRHEKFTQTKRVYKNTWEEHLGGCLDGYNQFVLLFDNVTLWQNTAYYAYYHGMKQNAFYFARDVDDEIIRYQQDTLDKLSNGIFDDRTIYVFDNELYERYKNCGLYFYPQNTYIVGVAKKL